MQKTSSVSGATNYLLSGANISHLYHGSDAMHFFFDAQNRPAICRFNGGGYAYLLNLQGDVIGLVDGTGAEVVHYTYDAWGKLLSVTGAMADTLGRLNPYRYRSYIYDEETGLYYLQSRYYNPEWNRFVNADCISKEFIMQHVDNCFAYCYNCPIMYVDQHGNYGRIFELGQGWYWRIDSMKLEGKIQRHIHIWKEGGDRFAQNEDGSVHDSLYGNPPKWVQKELYKKKIWKWKNNEGTPNKFSHPSNEPTRTPSSRPTPAPGPAPVTIPASDKHSPKDRDYSAYPNDMTAVDSISWIGVGVFIYATIKLLIAIPSGGLSLAFP